MARDWCKLSNGLKPVALMVFIQVIYAGLNVLYKLATHNGMSPTVLVAYRNIFAAAFLTPLAFFLERKSRPKLTWMIVFQAFLCGLFGGTVSQNLYIASMKLTSATFVSAVSNLTPAITYILAVTFRLEKLAIQTLPGQSKAVGTIICISGTMVLTFYKGVEINIWPWKVDLLKQKSIVAHHESGNHVMGSLLALASCFTYSIWLIIQANMSNKYPSHYSSTTLMCSMASIQSTAYAIFMDHDLSAWKLDWDIKLLTIFYAGVISSGLVITLIAWCLQKRGPMFVSMWGPLMLVMVAIAGSILLDEKLHLGSVLGAILIIVGLYAVLWGQGKEVDMKDELPIMSSETLEVEVLETYNVATKQDSKEPNMEQVSDDTIKC